jgi:hypothetical protein
VRVCADEHVSPEIVHAVREMALSQDWEITSVIEEGDGGSADDHWITRFARQGGSAILSADTDFLKVPVQVVAVFNTGVRVIHLPARWANAPCHMQASHILQWWKRIEIQIKVMKGRECYQPTWNLVDTGELKRIQIDYAEAHKKLKKANRRSTQAVP